jgi:SAM-dependent methyltransferase
VSGKLPEWGRRLDNPVLVQWEYASEERLRTRNALYRELTDGPGIEQFVFDAVAAAPPKRLLDAGCGIGDIGVRIADELGTQVIAVDSSPRMVQIAKERGLEASLADVQQLPFADGAFDCVLAAWVLYHVPDRPAAIAELARVLEPGGRLVAATLAAENVREIWDLLGEPWERSITFDRHNGAAQLEPYFASVERRDVDFTLTIPNVDALRRVVAAQLTKAHLAASVPDFEGPFVATAHHTIFVAEKAR